MIVLGIDPGFADTGWGVISSEGSSVSLVGYGSIQTSKRMKHPERLMVIHKEIQTLLKKYSPDLIGVEELFFYNNAKTVIKVGEARGVVLVTAVQAGVPIYEFTPLEVKQAITAYGRADKQQMQKMVQTILKLDAIPKPDDAADALGVALTCAQNYRSKELLQ